MFWENKNKKPTVSLSQWFTATWLCKAHDREGGSLHASISMWAGGSRAGQCVVLLLSFGVHALLYTLSHGWIQSHEGMRNGQGRGENITLASDETNVHDTKVSFVIPFYLYLLHKPDGCRSSMFRHIRTRPLSGMPSPAGATSSTVWFVYNNTICFFSLSPACGRLVSALIILIWSHTRFTSSDLTLTGKIAAGWFSLEFLLPWAIHNT